MEMWWSPKPHDKETQGHLEHNGHRKHHDGAFGNDPLANIASLLLAILSHDDDGAGDGDDGDQEEGGDADEEEQGEEEHAARFLWAGREDAQ